MTLPAPSRATLRLNGLPIFGTNMLIQDARRILHRILAPVDPDSFLDNILSQRFLKIAGGEQSYRRTILGDDPEGLILGAFRDLAPKLACHAAEPAGPPPKIEPVADARAFKAKIDAFHAAGYTVRIPQPRWLSPRLDEFLRALEFFLHKPAAAQVFWSRGDGKAPPHQDDYDLIAIQIRGHKRWFVSTDPASLTNPWMSGPVAPPALEHHEVVEMAPGDLLYLPRGTDHRVDALNEPSLHLSIGFAPLTLREAIAAALDHLSDFDRSFRQSVGNRLAFAVRANDFKLLAPQIREGLARLVNVCRSDEFIAEAMQRRSSRAIGDLEVTKKPDRQLKISATTVVRHDPLAISNLTTARGQIDFCHPGEHVFIHPGAGPSVVFIADTPQFVVGEIPPATIGDDIRVALVEKFISSGFLEVVGE